MRPSTPPVPERTIVSRRNCHTIYGPGGKLSDIGKGFSRFTAKQQPWMAARDDSAHHYAVVKVLAKGELSFEAFAVPLGDSPTRRLDAFRIS